VTDDGDHPAADSVYIMGADFEILEDDSRAFPLSMYSFTDNGGQIQRIPGNPEDSEGRIAEEYVDSEDAKSAYEELFEDHIDASGITHFNSIEEDDWMYEALHSGYGSE